MLKLIKIAIAPLALALSLSGFSASFADEASSPLTQPLMVDVESPGEGKESTLTPLALLIDQTVSFNGEGQAAWTYRSKGDMRLYLRNESNKRIHYRVSSPWSDYGLISGTVEPGRVDNFTFPLYKVHEELSWGGYALYVYNDDGSAGSFYVSARTLE